MSWYNEAIFYHIYPLGLTGAPKENDYGTPVHRLNTLLPWIDHIKEIGCTALYIGPLFESVGHGYCRLNDIAVVRGREKFGDLYFIAHLYQPLSFHFKFFFSHKYAFFLYEYAA